MLYCPAFSELAEFQINFISDLQYEIGKTCADPGIFVRGCPGQSDKKSSDNIFFSVFLSPQLILQKSNG